MHLHPGVGLALAGDQPGHIPGGQAAAAQRGQQQMRHVLTDARAELQRLGGRGAVAGDAGAVRHPAVDSLRRRQRGANGIPGQRREPLADGRIGLCQRRGQRVCVPQRRGQRPAPEQRLSGNAQRQLVVHPGHMAAGARIAEGVLHRRQRHRGRQAGLHAPELLGSVAAGKEPEQKRVPGNGCIEGDRQPVIEMKPPHCNTFHNSCCSSAFRRAYVSASAV